LYINTYESTCFLFEDLAEVNIKVKVFWDMPLYRLVGNYSVILCNLVMRYLSTKLHGVSFPFLVSERDGRLMDVLAQIILQHVAEYN
jgi:hypothetical protein